MKAVSVVRDPTSDMAVMARRGSHLLKEIRDLNERSKMRDKFWELAGTKQGNILGVEKKVAEDAEAAGELDQVRIFIYIIII
jgi:pre-mRNA-splicing factor ATP-dependent RNA helicase DHX38/PRP16